MSYMSDPLSGANGEEPPEAVWGGSYRSTYYYLLFLFILHNLSAGTGENKMCKKYKGVLIVGNFSTKRNQQDGSTRSK